jgi:hypothetical protein
MLNDGSPIRGRCSRSHLWNARRAKNVKWWFMGWVLYNRKAPLQGPKWPLIPALNWVIRRKYFNGGHNLSVVAAKAAPVARFTSAARARARGNAGVAPATIHPESNEGE